MTPRCPSDLALEAHLLDPERSPVAGHVAGCERCTARLAEMAEEGKDFRLYVFPSTVAAVESAAARRPWWRRGALLLPIPAAAALAAALLLLRPSAPPDAYVGLKGGGLGLTLFTPGPAGVAPVPDRTTVSPHASLRFRVRSADACHLWIASIDASGAVSRLYPPADGGEGALAVAGEQELPGGAVLDGQAGPERVYALCTPHAWPWDEVAARLRSAAARPGTVRDPAPLAGLPPGAAWTSILVEKVP